MWSVRQFFPEARIKYQHIMQEARNSHGAYVMFPCAEIFYWNPGSIFYNRFCLEVGVLARRKTSLNNRSSTMLYRKFKIQISRLACWTEWSHGCWQHKIVKFKIPALPAEQGEDTAAISIRLKNSNFPPYLLNMFMTRLLRAPDCKIKLPVYWIGWGASNCKI